MKSITINGSKREHVGKVATKALRNAGKVPCVIYGGENPIHFSAEELAFSKLVYTADAHTVVIALEDGNKIDAVMQDIQFHPVSDKILHVDFFQTRTNTNNLSLILSKISGFETYLSKSQKKNFELYPSLLDPNSEVWPVPARFDNHHGYVEYLKTWLDTRMEWLKTWL